MFTKPFSSLLPPPIHSLKKHNANVAASREPKSSNKDTVILDSLRPESLPTVSIKDFIPIRQRDFTLEIPLPTPQEIKKSYSRTKTFFDSILLKKLNHGTSPNDSNKQITKREASQVSENGIPREVNIIYHKADPLQPVTHRKRKTVAPSEEIQAPILHKTDEPGKKPTKEEIDKWRIPSAISNWKNPNSYAISLENRVSSNSKSNESNPDVFSDLSNALDEADRIARKKIQIKQEERKQLIEQESMAKEQKIRELAELSRREREQSRRYENEDHFLREQERNERRREQMANSKSEKVSTAAKLRMLAHNQGRDISEKVLLNVAKATETPEVQFDSRLFTQAASNTARDSSNIYDTPLFLNNQIDNIYKPPNSSVMDTDEIVDRISSKRDRSGPVEFSTADDGKDPNDDNKEDEVTQYGLQTKKSRKS